MPSADVDQKMGQIWENVFAAALAYKRMIRVYSCKLKGALFSSLCEKSVPFAFFGFG